MVFEAKQIDTNDGRKAVLRSAEVRDAEALLTYLKKTAAETRFLMREPEEITLTLEQEEAFLREKEPEERELMLIAEMDGVHVGNCSVSSLGNCLRYKHRCSMAIALYQEYCGLGIGKQMMRTALDVAKKCGYEQAELEVVTTNEQAIRLYQSLGFEIYGEQKHSMKYKDGSYADEYLMMKKL